MRGSWLWLTLPISNFNRFNTPVQTIVEQWIPASKNCKGKTRRYNMSRMRTLDLNCHTNPCGLTQGPALHMPHKTHTKGTIEFRVTKPFSTSFSESVGGYWVLVRLCARWQKPWIDKQWLQGLWLAVTSSMGKQQLPPKVHTYNHI